MMLMARAAANKATRQSNTQIWTVIVVLGTVTYVAIDIVLTLLRPNYNWLHNAESDYGRGTYFWIMDSNFLLRCFFSLALAKALLVRFRDKSVGKASIWIILWAVGSGLLAFFADNPYGYPKLWSGNIHILIALAAFVSAVVAMIVFRRLAPMMGLGSSATFLLAFLPAIAIISLILLGHAGFHPHSFGGFYERVFLAAVLAWQVVLALLVTGKQPGSTNPNRPASP